MICLSSAGDPAWFQMQVKFDYLSSYSNSCTASCSQWVHIVSNVTTALSATLELTKKSHAGAQSAFMLSKRRVSLALGFGWGENETLKQACRLDIQSAPVAFKNLMTHGSAIRIAYRTSLRSSSLWEPRYPSLRIWFLLLSLVRLLCVISLFGVAADVLPANASNTTAATEG